MANRKLVFLCAFVVSAVAVPVSKKEQCARYCTEERDFSLRPGTMYTYDYETTTTTAVQGSSQDKTQLQMTALVDIEVLSRCDLSLRLRGVTLKSSDPDRPDYLNPIRGGRDFASTVERHILRFSFQNGVIEHVCPSADAPVWVTNIHKGVLSAFQSNLVKLDWTVRTLETDVLGKCTVEYHSLGTSWQGTHTVRKIKDLSTCTERENIDTYLQGAPYSEDFQTKSLPMVKGTQECEQVIGQNLLQKSTCNEKLIFRPFSNGGNGVITTVAQKLTFAKTSQRTFTGDDYLPTKEALLFRHVKLEENPARREEEAEVALRELCEATKQDVSISVPRKFSVFVYKLKKLPLNSLRSLYQRADRVCPGNAKARKFFMDAIPLVATIDSAKFMYEMISRNAITTAESNFWLTSLSFVSEPTPEIISTFTPLLDGRHEQALLGVSALIHTFCKSNDCSQVPEIQTAVSRLIANLGENCYSPEDRKIIMTLKALSNIGLTFGREGVLEACYKNPQVRTETRLAAIQAFRRVSCDVSRGDLMRTYSNYNEDTEIRIAAYLAVMTCPSPATVQAVKDVLLKEKINHVGSFIWTHLLALSKTKHPERNEIRDIVSNLYLLNKYESDARKFSSAREATFFLESIDSGFHVDNHLIFSTDSYLPRSAMFNLTVDVFGKTCNLFQIDGRIEGFERAVESFFGPSGYFPQKNIAKVLREKRSVSYTKLDEMDESFDAKSRFQQRPYGSLDVKIFGTTLWYNQFQENEDGTTDINLLEVVTKLAEEQEREYSRSFMFLDTTFTVPMTNGLPLRIAVNGTASVGLKIGGKFDVKSFEHVDVLGHIEPSGAIEIASLLTVDVGSVARSGLRVVGTLHSSTVLDGKVEVRNGEVVKAQLNMPRDRIDIFNMQSKMYLVHGLEEREKTVDKKEGINLKSCSGETTSKILGVKFCSELQLPPYKPNSPLHPVNGPAGLSIYIQKTDPKLKSYNFDAQWTKETKNGAYVRYGMLSLNTPESQTDRDVKMEMLINQEDHTVLLKVKTPVKRLGVNAKLVNEDAQKKLVLGLTVDDQDYFSMQTELRTLTDKSSVTYLPSLEVRIPSRRLAAVTGSAYLKHGQKYTAQLQIEDLTQKPILAKGNLEIGKRDRYDGEFSISSFALDGTVKGYAQLGESMSSRITAEYKFLEGKTNRIEIVGKMRNLSANALMKYNGLINVRTSLLPEWNTEVSFETMRTVGHIENTVSISLGDGVRSRVHNIRYQEILRYDGTLKNNKIAATVSLKYPEKGVDYVLDMNHENTENSLKNTLKLQYDSNKELTTQVQVNVNQKQPISFVGDVQLSYPGRDAAVSASFSETNPNEYKATGSCQWREGRRISASVQYKDRSDNNRIKYEVDGEINLPTRIPIVFSTTVGSERGQYAGLAELKMGVDRYRVKADYAKGNGFSHRLNGQLLLKSETYGLDSSIQYQKSKLSCNAEVKMPNRHRVTAKFEGRVGDSFKSGYLETLWDADRDTSKRFGLNGEIRTQNDGYDGKFSMQIRRRTISGLLSTSLQGNVFGRQWKTNNKFELEWSPSEKASAAFSTNILLDRYRQQVNSHVEVTTPFYGFENLTLGITHMYANQQWDSEIAAILPRTKSIMMSSSGKYSFVRGGATFETKAKVQSSFAILEEVVLELSHDHNPRELTSSVMVNWGRERGAAVLVSGFRQPSALRGTVKVTSPFQYFEDLSAEVTHNYAPDNYKTRAEFQWAPSKKISVNFEGNHVLSGRRRICTIALDGISPFRGFERITSKVTYSNDGISLNTDSEVTWNRKKVTTSFTGSIRNSVNNKNMESKLLITSPFKNYENIQISSSLEANSNSYKINIDTQLPYHSTASLNSQGKMEGLNDVELNAVVIAHFPRYMSPQRVSVDFVHKLLNSKMRSSFDATYGNNRLTVLLIGLTEVGYNSRNIEFSASMSTPFVGYEELKADLTHNKRGSEYLSKLQMSKNQLSGSLTHKLYVRDALNFETFLEMTSTTSLPSGKISVIQVSDEGQLEHSSYILWDKNKKINFNAQYLGKSFLKEFIVKLTTPFRRYREVEFKSSYENQNWDHKAAISAIWDRRNKMTVSADLRNYRWQNVNAQLEVTSSFKGYEFYSATAKYDITAPQKIAEFSYLWDVTNRKAITTKGSFLNSYRLSSIEMEVTTPFADFDRINFAAKYENSPPEKSVNVFYERGWRKITFNGKTILRNSGSQITFDFSSPFETLTDLSASAKYDRLNYGMSGEVSTQWNQRNKYQIKGKYELKDMNLEGNAFVLTPVRGYENANIEVKADYGHSEKLAEISFRWSNDKRILLGGNYNGRRDGGELKLNLQSSFADYREITFYSRYKMKSGHYEGEMKASLNQRHVYQANTMIKYKGQHLLELEINLNSPHSPFRNVQLTSTLDSNSETNQFLATLKWENEEANIQLLLKKRLNQYYETQIKVKTPFSVFRYFNFEGSVRRDNYKFLDARVNLETPFELLRSFDASSEITVDDSGCRFIFVMNTPQKKLNMQGKLSNRQFQPLSASLDIEAPFLEFSKLTANAEVNIARWNNAKTTVSLTSSQFRHVFDASFIQEDGKLNFEMKADSSSLASRMAIATLKADYENINNIEGEASVQIFGNVHYINGLYRDTGRDMETEIKVESSLLPEKKAAITSTFSRRRNYRIMDGKLSFVVPSSSHQISAKYESKGNQISANMKIDTNILSFSTLEAQAKYINSNKRDIEAAISVFTPDAAHTVVGSLKNYDGEKFVQLKIECPFASSYTPFSITGSLKHEGYESMDGSLTLGIPGKEVRVAGNMKKNGWEDIEAFLTVNTPFEVLRLVRVDGRFRNERFQNFDCNFQLETSNSNLPSFGMTSKLSRTVGSEDISLMFQLPLRNYRTVQLLANAHYAADYSSADSRITLTLPSKRYSAYGQYGINGPRISGTTELESDRVKWVSSGRLESTPDKKDISISVTMPSSNRYNFGAAYGRSNNRKYIAATYTSPSDERYNLNASLRYDSIKHFEGDIKIDTPFREYRSLEGSINHQYHSNYMSTSMEYTKNMRRGFLRVVHRSTRNGATGTVQMGCPYANLRDMKLSYKHVDEECSLELDMHRVKQFKAELLGLNGGSRHVMVDVPVLPLTITADDKRMTNGRELNFKSDYNSRIVAFRTSYQVEQRQFLHDAAFTWDEKAEKRISYDFRMGDADTGKEIWSRVDTPLRSIMVKGNFTKTSRARSGGFDIYWDASRSLEKRIAVGVVHTDISTSSQTSHRVQVVLEHPKLSRDVVQTTVVSLSQKEFLARSELHYSRERQHHMTMEIKASDLSKSHRDSHYKSEFILRHPISRLDIRANAELMDSKLESGMHLKLNTADKQRAQNIREVRAKIFKLRQQIELMMRDNEDQTSLQGQIGGRGGDVDISLEKKVNERMDLMSQVRFSRRNRMLDISIMNAENTGLQASASFPDDSANLKISHSNQGNVVTDVNVFLGLEQSRILKSQVNWRPRMWEELRITTGENLRAILKSSKELYSSVISSVCEEWAEKFSLISRAMRDELSPFLNDVGSVFSEIGRDLKTVKRSFLKMYDNNEFFMKDIVSGYEKMKQVARDVADGLVLACEVLCNIVTEFVEDCYHRIYYICLDFIEYLQRLQSELLLKAKRALRATRIALYRSAEYCVDKLEDGIDYMYEKAGQLKEALIIQLDKWIRAYAPCIIDGYYYTKNAADKIRYSINGIYNSMSDCIISNRYYIALSNYASSVIDTIQAFLDYEYSAAAQDFLNRVYDAQILDSILNHPNVEYMSSIANSALRKSVEIYHNLGLDIAVSSAAETVSNYVKTAALSAAQDFLAEFYQLKGGAKYDFAPERGYMAVEFNLPTTRNSLVEVFDFKSYPEYQKMISMKNTLATDYYEDFCIWDFYYKVVKYFTPGYWLPSFTAHAIISGNQHYITFDKLPFEFAGRCSYLLARDFVDGNFSVIVNYGQDHKRKSLTILSEGKKVDISHDYKITLDDMKAESPIQIGRTVVIREGANIRIENEKKGFSVVCNFVYNYCSVLLSGFYYAKTGGLFGTYNHEPKLDLMTPSRHLAEDLETFANSWEVGQAACRPSENLATIPSNDYRVQQKCRSLFEKSSSEFRACFKQVDPEPYLKMCINDLSAVHESRRDAAMCESAAAYFVECKMEGVPLKMPKHCVQCEKQDGTMMKEGEAIKFTRENKVTAADVVFLVEEKECNRDRVKYLGKLAQSIEENFRQKGYNDVRYSVVAFGGDEIHAMPHIHTLDGQESGSLRSLDSAFQSLVYGDGPINILEALRFAAALNFRPGTTKSFVLVKCSTCKPEEVKAEYSEMLRTLLDGDITLHLLMDQRYDLKVGNKNSKARKVIGVDKKLAYTLKDVKDTRSFGDGDLLAQLKIPKDVCIPLALEVNGSSFDAHFLTETKKNTNKKFMDVLSRLVVRSASEGDSEWGVCCECIATVDGVGKSTCQRCVSAEIANMISANTSGINNAPSSRREVKDAPRSRVRKHKERGSGL